MSKLTMILLAIFFVGGMGLTWAIASIFFDERWRTYYRDKNIRQAMRRRARLRVRCDLASTEPIDSVTILNPAVLEDLEASRLYNRQTGFNRNPVI